MKKKKIYTVANAHLDTIWSWDFETTVSKYICKTIRKNMKLFDKYPDYKFNFEGAYRYELMEEYYPELFEKVKEKIKEGRWNVCGSAYENGDVNIPSPEALFRNFLYGNGYFKKKFGKTSCDIFLPDCFGFGWALPSIAHHTGLKGFSSQKLSWGSAYGEPFDIGKWYGVDGNCIYASIKMLPYVNTFKKIRGWDKIGLKLSENDKYGLDMTAVYHGTGDRGGAPREKSVITLQKEIEKNPTCDIEVISARADELFEGIDKLDDSIKDRLPVWNNELLMSTHAVGSYVSRSIGKRWNRKGEELADMAERSAVCAFLLGREYPSQSLEKCWKRIISHQFHDDITGTSVQRAYRRCWNDYALSLNQLTGEYEAAVSYIADRMDTSWTKGTAVIVNNCCEYDRNGIVELEGDFNENSYIAKDKAGNTYPCQKTKAGLLFFAEVKALGYKVFDLIKGNADCDVTLLVRKDRLENENLIVKTDENGWVASIFDKQTGSELLKAPIKLALYDYNGSKDWPAWEIDNYEALENAHYPTLIKSEVTENGPCRVCVRLIYEYAKSRFETKVSLSKAGKAVEFQNEILWHEFATLAKQEFVLNASNKEAAFDLGFGCIKRGNRTDKLYEVPAQKWADITDEKTKLGVSVISDSKYSWDKYNDNTLRLTVLHTPKKNYRIDSMQSMMDLGINRYGFAVTSHNGSDFSKTNRCAKEFHQPLTGFICSKHDGYLGDELSLGRLVNENVILRAVKKAEDSDAVVLRFNEANGKQTDGACFSFDFDVKDAKEILASEDVICDAVSSDNTLSFDIEPYGIRSFALTCKRKNDSEKAEQITVKTNGNAEVYSSNGSEKKALLPSCGLSVPSELVQEKIFVAGKYFETDKNQKAVLCSGQRISLPEKTAKVHLLCASLTGDKTVTINGQQVTVNSMTERYAGWDLYDYKETAFIKNGSLAAQFTHCHSKSGDEIAKQLYFWSVTVDTCSADVLELPNDADIIILAITADKNEKSCLLSTQLYDRIEKREFTFEMNDSEKRNYRKYRRFSKMNDKGRYLITMNK